MLQVGSFDEWRPWVASLFALVLPAALMMPFGAAPHVLLMLAFGASVLNIVASERTTGTLTGVDLALLLITGFTASAYGAPSIGNEIVWAALRMFLLGGAVGALALAYQRWRGIPGLGTTDIILIGILGAFLPLAIAIYAVAFAITLTIAALAAMHLLQDEQTSLGDQFPIASTLSVLYFCVWVAYRLKADVTF